MEFNPEKCEVQQGWEYIIKGRVWRDLMDQRDLRLYIGNLLKVSLQSAD